MKALHLRERGKAMWKHIVSTPAIFLLIYWIFYLIVFLAEEHFIVEDYWVSYTPLDDKIPFCKWFAIPYAMWYPYIILPMVWLFFRNVPEFKRLMWFIMITYTVALITYAVFPNGQDLRPSPEQLEGDGLLLTALRFLYSYDTNTNVLPSVHVIGTMSITFSLLQLKPMRRPLPLLLILAATASICASIVMIKQHSILDLYAALIVCFAAYPAVYNRKMKAIAESNAILPLPRKKKPQSKTEATATPVAEEKTEIFQ